MNAICIGNLLVTKCQKNPCSRIRICSGIRTCFRIRICSRIRVGSGVRICSGIRNCSRIRICSISEVSTYPILFARWSIWGLGSRDRKTITLLSVSKSFTL